MQTFSQETLLMMTKRNKKNLQVDENDTFKTSHVKMTNKKIFTRIKQ